MSGLFLVVVLPAFVSLFLLFLTSENESMLMIRNKQSQPLMPRHERQDFYGMGMGGGGYGHHHPQQPAIFNAYGQPMSAAASPSPFIPPHMQMHSMYQPPGHGEVLPASVQLRLDQLATTGFCHPGEIDDRCEQV